MHDDKYSPFVINNWLPVIINILYVFSRFFGVFRIKKKGRVPDILLLLAVAAAISTTI
jgi:hypothetical protein